MRFGFGFARHSACANGAARDGAAKAGVFDASARTSPGSSLAVVALLIGALTATGAQAQSAMVGSDTGGQTTVAKSSIGLGAAVVIKPKYEGSQEHEAIPLPIILPRFQSKPEDEASPYAELRRRVAFRGLDDIRIRVLGKNRFQVGAVTGWITSRDEDDADFLKGTGDIDGGLVGGAYAAYTMGLFTFDAAYIEKLTGTSAGPQYRFSVETTRPISDRGDFTIVLGTTFASEDFMQTYFGITPTQSRRSRANLPVYSPGGGIKDVYIEMGGSYDLTERWVFKGGVRYGRLLDEAADSPLVETPDQVSGTVGLAYRFHWNR